jgi:hypothetical protein
MVFLLVKLEQELSNEKEFAKIPHEMPGAQGKSLTICAGAMRIISGN